MPVLVYVCAYTQRKRKADRNTYIAKYINKKKDAQVKRHANEEISPTTREKRGNEKARGIKF